MDGWLSEEAWSQAQHISNFTQRELNFGEPVSERTEVAILFDHEALYVGFWGFDREPGRILANEMARDFSWSGEDNFEFVLDPFNDDRNGYLFVTNPNGALAGEWGVHEPGLGRGVGGPDPGDRGGLARSASPSPPSALGPGRRRGGGSTSSGTSGGRGSRCCGRGGPGISTWSR